MANSVPNLPVTRAPHARLTDAERAAFLTALSNTGSHAAASRAIGRPRSTLHSYTEAHEEFAGQCESALDAYAATLLATAHKLAVEGVEVPIMHAGAIVAVKVKHSEKLLLKLLERLGPREFAPIDKKTVEHTGTVQIEHREAPQAIPVEVFAAMSIAARLEYKRALIIGDVKRGVYPDGDGDYALMTAIAELSVEAERAGFPFDAVATFKECRAAPLQIEDATYKEVTEPTDEEIDAQLAELF